MPQPAPGFAPIPSARPDYEAELLQALGLRDAPTSLRLLQHLVHRRGVGALESLRCRSLALEPDQRGWLWLSELVASEPIAGLSLHSSLAGRAIAASHPAPEDQTVSGLSQIAGVSAALTSADRLESAEEMVLPIERVPPAGPGDVALATLQIPGIGSAAAAPELGVESDASELRAEAAVDAAFEALAAEFPDDAPRAVAELAPEGLAPLPMGLEQPDQSGEPGLISPIDWADGSPLLEAPLQVLEEPPAESFNDLAPDSSVGLEPVGRVSFVIPRALDQPLAGTDGSETTAPSGNSDTDGHSDGEESWDGQPPAAEALGAQSGRLFGRAGSSLAGLRDRLGRRLSLTRVKTLVRDCLEEAVSNFQGQNPAAESEPQDGPEQEVGSAAVASSREPWPLPELDSPMGGLPAVLPEHQAPVAAFGPPLAGESWLPVPVAAEPPARLSPTQQVRQRLLGRRQDATRPAPAPQALSDLRAWLAADDDLPRAS